MKNKNYFNIIFVAAMIFNTAVAYSQTTSPQERRNLNSLTGGELLMLNGAIIFYLNSSTAIADHMSAPDALDIHSGTFDWGENFLSWHRTYIQGLETYLAVNGYSQFVPLPKWNPSNLIPSQFQGNNAVADPTLYDPIEGVGAAVISASQWDRTFDNLDF